MKAKTRKLTTSLIVLVLFIWLIPLLASQADATGKSEPTLTVYGLADMGTTVNVKNSSSSVIGTATTATNESNPLLFAQTEIATDTDIASDDSIPASQTDIDSPPPTSSVSPSPAENTNVGPKTSPIPNAQPNTIPDGNGLHYDNPALNNDVAQPVAETNNDNQLSIPSPTSPVTPPNKSNPKEIIKRAWTFIKKNNYIATSGTSTVLLITVGISLIYDFKLIFWYRKKKKEEKSCKY